MAVKAGLAWPLSPVLLCLVVGQLGAPLAPAQNFTGQKMSSCQKAAKRGERLIQGRI